jgi:hypothetical protein
MKEVNVNKNACRRFPIMKYRPAHTQHADIPNKEAGAIEKLIK